MSTCLLIMDDIVNYIACFKNLLSSHRRVQRVRHELHRRELTLEFALHASGVACAWARQARVGDAAVIGGPRGSMIVPTNYDGHVLAGDASALPAIHRRLEELHAGSRAVVLVHVDQPEDQRAFQSAAKLDVQWLPTTAALLQSIAQLQLPDGDGFIWCAGEAASMTQVRQVMLVQRQVPREATRISAYWKMGAADYHEPKGP